MTNKAHWEKVFQTKSDQQKSWFEEYPQTSIQFIKELKIPRDAAIIDVGGGDSHLVDALLEEGYNDITVLDISATALERAKLRLGEKGRNIHWIVGNVLDFSPSRKYDYWHDRAVFHFVTAEDQISVYKKKICNSITDSGKLVVATFSENGPESCSGLPVRRYSQQSLAQFFSSCFSKIKCITENHETPSHSLQSFTFCSFRKNKSEPTLLNNSTA